MSTTDRIIELENCLRQIQKITRDQFLKNPNIIGDLIREVLTEKPKKKK